MFGDISARRTKKIGVRKMLKLKKFVFVFIIATMVLAGCAQATQTTAATRD
jgi:uncharacterized lipoprotein YajG